MTSYQMALLYNFYRNRERAVPFEELACNYPRIKRSVLESARDDLLSLGLIQQAGEAYQITPAGVAACLKDDE